MGPVCSWSTAGRKTESCVWKSKGRCGAAKCSSGQKALLRGYVRAGELYET